MRKTLLALSVSLSLLLLSCKGTGFQIFGQGRGASGGKIAPDSTMPPRVDDLCDGSTREGVCITKLRELSEKIDGSDKEAILALGTTWYDSTERDKEEVVRVMILWVTRCKIGRNKDCFDTVERAEGNLGLIDTESKLVPGNCFNLFYRFIRNRKVNILRPHLPSFVGLFQSCVLDARFIRSTEENRDGVRLLDVEKSLLQEMIEILKSLEFQNPELQELKAYYLRWGGDEILGNYLKDKGVI